MRVIIITVDGLGAGEAPDSAVYGDAGANTLGHVAEMSGGTLKLPMLERMGLGNIGEYRGIRKDPAPVASSGKMRELSAGKDTITGHWEMMGVINPVPFPTYPHGFPPGVIEEFEHRTGRRTIGNRPASGTRILEELGDEHVRTGALIVYTSADSVFQIAAHEGIVPVEELYRVCETAREVLRPPNHVCRVIARPFTGTSGAFIRTAEKRKDFSLPPPEKTVLDFAQEKGIPVYSVGKVAEMFAMRGFTDKVKCGGNTDALNKLKTALENKKDCLIFSVLTDTDTLYGHRNDYAGFARALSEFDAALGGFILPMLRGDDYLFITADHGCDPTMPGTDHTRELVPIIFYHAGMRPTGLGTREGFVDLGATVAGILGIKGVKGKSFFS
jgi:phosphopentomutase